MGQRFQNSISLVPDGVHVCTALRLDQPRPYSRSGTAGPPTAVIGIDDSGKLEMTDGDGHPLVAADYAAIRVRYADAIRRLLENRCRQLNLHRATCQNVHEATPFLPPEPPAPFSVAPPDPPDIQPGPQPGLLGRLLRHRQQIRGETEALQARYQHARAHWELDRKFHEFRRTSIRTALQSLSAGSTEGIEDGLRHVLSRVTWPRETRVEYRLSPSGTAIALDFELGAEQALPSQTAEVGEDRILYRRHSVATCRQDFVHRCYGTTFRLIGEIFALAPGLQRCLVSAYLRRPAQISGQPAERYYLISVRVSREQWESVDGFWLDAVDPRATLEGFGARVQLDSSFRFRPIQPLPASALEQPMPQPAAATPPRVTPVPARPLRGVV